MKLIELLRRYGLWGFISIIKNILLTKLFFSTSRIIRFPIRVRGKKNINFGRMLTTGIGCRLDALNDNKGKSILFGNDIQINDYVHIAAIESVIIGDRVLIASNVFISDHNHGSYGVHGKHSSPLIPPEKRELSSSPVMINDDVWLGEFVTILPGVTIGKGAVIGAMSVVTKNIPAYSIAVGSPARVVKQYDFNCAQWVKV